MNIEVKGLYKYFEDFKLDNISINIPKGKIVGLIGSNGAGKTTLLKCIMGIIHIDKGNIKIFDKDRDYLSNKDIGVVFDDSFMNGTFNIKDIDIIMKNIYDNWDSKLFYLYMDKFKIPRYKRISKLSTGMKKKIEIATAFCHKPKLLILDEPTSGLDPIIRSEILDMLVDFVKNKDNSVLLSTHIISDLEHIADNIIFIDNGNIILDRSLKDIRDNYIILDLEYKDFNSFNKDIIIRYKKNRLDYQVLINKDNMIDKYKKYIKNITSLEDIMILYIRGLSC